MPTRIFIFFLALTVSGLALATTCAVAPAGPPPRLALEPVASSGIDAPVYVTHAGDGSTRLFVVEKDGRIRIIDGGEVLDEPFLDISELIITEVEQGLLSVAFHPNYAENGRFFVYYSADEPLRSVVAEYRVSADPNRANPEGRVVLEQLQPPWPIHKAGQLQFGPDGYLYISFGDGGGNPFQAQNLDNLLGTISRIDVDSQEPYGIPDSNPFADPDIAAAFVRLTQADYSVLGNLEEPRAEIWAYGFRNPWRFSFDACTGRLFVGDVGSSWYEEVNLVEFGMNYGWPFTEGPNCHPEHPEVCASGPFALPLHVYPHLRLNPSGGNAVVGGYVYRGRAFPELAGRYLFTDVGSGRIWALSEGQDWRVDEVFQRDGSTFGAIGEDEDGELYIVSINGDTVERIVIDEVTD